MQGGQFGPGRHPEFQVEDLAGDLVHRLRLAGPARAVQGQHEQALGPLAQRVFRGEGAQGGDGRDVPVQAEFQGAVEVVLPRGEPQLGQPVPLGLGVRAGQPRQRGAGPEPDGVSEGAVGLAGGPRGAQPGRGGESPLELVDVQHRFVQPQGVAVGGGHQQAGRCAGGPVGFEEGAQPGHVRPQGAHGARWRPLAPERIQEFGHGGGPPPPQQQDGEQGPLLVRPQGQLCPAGCPGGHRPEQPKPQPGGLPGALVLAHSRPIPPHNGRRERYFDGTPHVRAGSPGCPRHRPPGPPGGVPGYGMVGV